MINLNNNNANKSDIQNTYFIFLISIIGYAIANELFCSAILNLLLPATVSQKLCYDFWLILLDYFYYKMKFFLIL